MRMVENGVYGKEEIRKKLFQIHKKGWMKGNA